MSRALLIAVACALASGCVTVRSKNNKKTVAVITPGGPVTDAAATAILDPEYRSQYKVEGTCDIISADGMNSPCLGITLVLLVRDDAEGKELSRARVTEAGRFAFAAEREGKYRLVLDSQTLQLTPESEAAAQDAKPNRPLHLVLVARKKS